MLKILFLPLFLVYSQAWASTVLVVGDSHVVGPFGSTLDSLLRENNRNVATYGSCGSIASWWASAKATTCGFFSRDLEGNTTATQKAATPILKNLMNEISPDHVIIEFGANYLGYESDSFIRNDLKAFIETIKEKNATCLFVTLPDSRYKREEIPRIVKIIKEVSDGACDIFESTKVTEYPSTGGDGIHYSNSTLTPVAKNWAKLVFQAFNSLNP